MVDDFEMIKILITGGNGQVGSELSKKLASIGQLTVLTRHQLDLANTPLIQQVLNDIQPDIIINAAAYTAVDRAETDIEQAMAINAIAPKIFAEWSENNGSLLIHYSTDYVFDGQKTGKYKEEDQTRPKSIYGQSKREGEKAICLATKKYVTLRTSWVFSVHGNNFLKTMLRLSKERNEMNIVSDQIGAPTSARLIADVTKKIIEQYVQSTENFDYGLYHLTAQGETSWYEYAKYVIDIASTREVDLKLKAQDIHPILSSEYPVAAQRPLNSRLDCSRLMQNFNIQLPDWKQDVKQDVECLCDSKFINK